MFSSAQAEESHWLNTLLKANEFADGFVGEAPYPSACYIAFQEALLDPEKIEDKQIDLLLKNGTPEGKIYGACISYYAKAAQKHVAERDNAFKQLKSDKSKVHYRSGCRATDSTVGEVADALLKEKHFLNFKLGDLSDIKKTKGLGIPDPILRLARAKRLESDVVGEGSKSPTYAWFKEASQLPIKPNGMEIYWLSQKGSAAGRLYAGFLAMEFDADSGIAVFKRLETDQSKVQYQSGCEVENFTVGNIARQVVEKRKFLDFPTASKKRG